MQHDAGVQHMVEHFEQRGFLFARALRREDCVGFGLNIHFLRKNQFAWRYSLGVVVRHVNATLRTFSSAAHYQTLNLNFIMYTMRESQGSCKLWDNVVVY
jgi:hypothetical protein